MYEIPATNEGEQKVYSGIARRCKRKIVGGQHSAASAQHSARAKTFRCYADFFL